MASSGPLALPIGQFFGSFYPVTRQGPPVHQIRLVGEIRELDDARFAVWRHAHEVPDPRDPSWTAQGLATLALLRAERLIADVIPGTPESIGFARTHRLGHRMLGLGNSAAQPWTYTIGFFDRPVVGVSRDLYNLWESCDLADDLWTAVAALAAGGSDDSDDPAVLLAQVLGQLHHLLAASVVYLEPCP